MGLFRSKPAQVYDKMAILKEVVISEKTVKFELNYSTITLNITDIPKIFADIVDIHADTRHILIEMSEEANKEKKKQIESDGGTYDPTKDAIDLSKIPF